MTERPSVFRRAAAGVVGAGGPAHRPPTIVQQRHLPLGRRLLVSLLGVRVRPDRSATAPASVPQVSERRPGEAGLGPRTLPDSAVRPAERYAEPAALLREDRIAYERLLDQALTSFAHSSEPAAGPWPGPEQLRNMALQAREVVMAVAAAEYQHFLRVRAERLRTSAGMFGWGGPADARTRRVAAAGAASPPPGAAPRPAPQPVPYAPRGRARRKSVPAVAAVLLGAAAVTLLLLALGPAGLEHDLAPGLVTVGLCLASATAGLVLGALLRRPRRRHYRRTLPAGRNDDPYAEVERARQAWLTALLERGILPFLRQAVDEAGGPAAEPPRTTRAPHAGDREPREPGRPPE
ncbi:hypothetical protein GCM10010451_57800 [Streptomyces virens]|uniref:Uncharacterized protein n=1 Tax=Streptomyces virens TaxID=285572 RepID=A0ABP6Q1Q7_9ACTN|nr:hypothetical protein [Streptomyces calvus]MBA8976258.1 hypothetical protein [Streptomyces calvus]